MPRHVPSEQNLTKMFPRETILSGRSPKSYKAEDSGFI
jgi:hypothetical protein